MATRYKISKEQLERVVENFVMEAASKAPVKNMIPSQGAEAKKHVKNKMTGKMVEKGEGVPSVNTMKKKLSQAPESKKHMSNSKMTHSNKAKVVKESGLEEGKVGDFIKKKVRATSEYLGFKMSPEDAEKLYNETYKKHIGWFVKNLKSDEDTIKKALIKFFIESGGKLVPTGEGKNAEWDSSKKEFVRLGSELGGPTSNTNW